MRGIARWGFGLVALTSIVWWASSGPVSRADDAVSDPAVEARSDFNQLLAQAGPDGGSVGIVSINGAALSGMNFPHMALYGGANSSGWPFVGTKADTRPSDTAPLNTETLDHYARFQEVILPATPLADTRTDIIPALRARNPQIKVMAYVMGHTTWCPLDAQGNIAYAPGVYFRDYWLTVTGGDPSCATQSGGLLWAQDGILVSSAPHNMGINVNLAHRVQNPDLSYRYDVAEGIAQAMYNYGKRAKNFDGMFVDVFCPGIMWMESPGHLFDYVRAGYGVNQDGNGNFINDAAARAAFDSGWQAAFLRLAQRLRELSVADGQPDYVISGNCAQAPASIHQYFNGWMRENYPYQNGGSFYSNFLSWPWGLLHQDVNFKAPQYNYVFTAAIPNGSVGGVPTFNPYDAANQRAMRYGLGSTTMGNGIHAFHESSGDTSRGFWYEWWFDEYGVNVGVPQSNPTYGQSATGAQYTGWLGQPLTSAYQYLSDSFAGTTDLLTTNRGFETAGASPSQIPSWNFFASSPGVVATAVRDTSTSGEGAASVKIQVDHLSTPDPIAYAIALATGSFSVTANNQYSITFKAKASETLPVGISFSSPNTESQILEIDTTWRQYQMVITPSNTVTGANMRFDLGRATGTIWLDDVHVQAAPTAVWRRDFQRGIVLLNPTAISQTVTLEQPYKRIQGTVNPTLNDGSAVTQVTLPGTLAGAGMGDAAFLLTIDQTAPAAVQDLR